MYGGFIHTHFTTKTLRHASRPVLINEAISLHVLLFLLVFLVLLLLPNHQYWYAPHLLHHFHQLILAILLGRLLLVPMFFSLLPLVFFILLHHFHPLLLVFLSGGILFSPIFFGLLILVFLILLLLPTHHYWYFPHLFHHFHQLLLDILLGRLLFVPIFFGLLRRKFCSPLLTPLPAQGIAELGRAVSAFGVGMETRLGPRSTTSVSLLWLRILRRQTAKSAARPTRTARHTKVTITDPERWDIDSALPSAAGISGLRAQVTILARLLEINAIVAIDESGVSELLARAFGEYAPVYAVAVLAGRR